MKLKIILSILLILSLVTIGAKLKMIESPSELNHISFMGVARPTEPIKETLTWEVIDHPVKLYRVEIQVVGPDTPTGIWCNADLSIQENYSLEGNQSHIIVFAKVWRQNDSEASGDTNYVWTDFGGDTRYRFVPKVYLHICYHSDGNTMAEVITHIYYEDY